MSRKKRIRRPRTRARARMVKTRTIRQRVKLPQPPETVYRALTSSYHHETFTGAAAHFPMALGRQMSAYGGYITGTVLGLFPGRGLVQTWRTTEWPPGCEDSRVEIILEASGKGTRLTLIHSRVPLEFAPGYARGWRLHYWKPLCAYLSGKPKSDKKSKRKHKGLQRRTV